MRETLGAKFVKPDEREAVKSSIKQHSTYEIIDKISVRLIETHDKYWARLSNLSQDFINIDESVVREHDRLLMGGIWAEIVLRYDDSFIFRGQNRPFFVERLRPIQLSTRNVERFVEGRRRFTTDQWLDLLLRSMGYEPNHPYYTRRRKLHYMLRLVPFVERNYNLVELGPRGTGKSFVYQQLSPYCHLVSGGQTTSAQMFVNLGTGQRGLVALWDVVAFDEAAGIRFSDKNGLNIMKGYMEDGTFSRGRDIINAEGSMVFVGNIDGDIETIVRTSNCSTRCPRRRTQRFTTGSTRTYRAGSSRRHRMMRTPITSAGDGLSRRGLPQLRRASYGDYAEESFRFGSHLGGGTRRRRGICFRFDQATSSGWQGGERRRLRSTSLSRWRCAGASRSSFARWAALNTGIQASPMLIERRSGDFRSGP